MLTICNAWCTRSLDWPISEITVTFSLQVALFIFPRCTWSDQRCQETLLTISTSLSVCLQFIKNFIRILHRRRHTLIRDCTSVIDVRHNSTVRRDMERGGGGKQLISSDSYYIPLRYIYASFIVEWTNYLQSADWITVIAVFCLHSTIDKLFWSILHRKLV
jgi:hypothetical protein